jgi:uncharacterized membrane protein
MTMLLLACLAFVGTHLLMSHPLRGGLVKALGASGFMGVYSLVSLACFGWIILAFRTAPVGETVWAVGDGLWALASLIMLLASILLMGSLIGNPALPVPNAADLLARPPAGVFTITRHPMMWAFILWAIAHALVSPRPAVLVLCVAMAALALFGSLGQDAKKAKLMGAAWQAYADRTAFIPFARGAGFPGMHALGGGLLVWLFITWAHPLLGGPIAGLWRWL